MGMTYNTLINDAMDYVDRTDANTISALPNIIYRAHQRICREAENIGFEVYATGNLIPTVAVYQKPANWRRNITFNIGIGDTQNTRTPVQLRSYEYLLMNYPDRTDTGTPVFYSDYGFSNYIVAPTPDIAYPFEFAFLEMPPPLTVNLQTNWLTNFAPDVLLDSVLLELMIYLKDDERIPAFQNKYQTGIAGLLAQDAYRIHDRQSNRKADGRS